MRFLFAFFLLLPALHAAPPIFPLKDVKPGLKGECRTVFSGMEIQSFGFEVMGIARDFIGPGLDVIWCRMLTDPTGQKVVAAGMSGSPCFIDGRNMGALAFGLEFNKDPVFGVQPIESMLQLLDFKGNERVGGRSRDALQVRQRVAHSTARSLPRLLKSLAGFQRPVPQLPAETAPQLMPLPLEVSGLHPLIADQVLQGLSEAGFTPQLSAGGGSSRTVDASDLVPGSAVTGVIATGDLNMAVTGTLTWRDGDKVLVFGHPFLGVGAVSIPLGKAEIVGVLSSYQRSVKLSNKGDIVGTLTQDRLAAVGGVIGLMPRLTPMTVNIRLPRSSRSYKVEFCDNKFFTPGVYQIAMLQFLANVLDRSEESTIKLKSEIQLEGLPSLRFEDVFAGEMFSWVFGSVLLPSLQMLPLYQNEFATPRIRHIAVDIEVTPVLQKATLQEVSVDPLEAHAGDVLRVRSVFQPWHGKRFHRDDEVKLPEEVKSGEVEIIVADARRMDQLKGVTGMSRFFPGSSASGAEPRNLGQLIESLNKRHRNDQLHLVLQRKSAGLYLQNQRLTALPGSVQSLLAEDPGADRPAPIADVILSETAVGFGSVVEGSRSVKIKIK